MTSGDKETSPHGKEFITVNQTLWKTKTSRFSISEGSDRKEAFYGEDEQRKRKALRKRSCSRFK